MARTKRKEGRPLSEKPEDKIWKEEFKKMTLDDHKQKLRELGLEEEDLEEFDKAFDEEKPKKQKLPQ
ncbi:MAG: hypothetical protein ABIA76_04845 [Candidatus Diapherotrites archaeon]